jgi:hypothetical protein
MTAASARLSRTIHAGLNESTIMAFLSKVKLHYMPPAVKTKQARATAYMNFTYTKPTSTTGIQQR